MSSLNWKLDITEYNDDGTVFNTFTAPLYGMAGTFSYGLNAGSATVSNIYFALWLALDNAQHAAPPLTQRGYAVNITADAGMTAGEGAGAGPEPDELIINYQITCTHGAGLGTDDSRKFQINFDTGPTNQVVVPATGDIHAAATIKNDPYPAVAVFPSYYSTVVAVQDKPPMIPDVEFIPFRGVNNRILLLISGQSGNRWDVPIVIEPGDADKFASIYASQDPANFPYVEFRSDDPVTAYQIFRTTSPPMTYNDFQGKLLTEYSQDTYAGREVPLLPYEDDTIIPNTKYYYCFRAMDIHGNISNPSAVYQFEMVDNNGQIYPVIEMYQKCADVSGQSYTKAGKRFIYIAPSTRQTTLNADPATNLGASQNSDWSNLIEGQAPPNDLLGALDVDKVWNNIFKVRITSKKTGRKVDLNLIFKNTGVIEP